MDDQKQKRIEPCTAEDRDIIREELLAYNRRFLSEHEDMSFCIRDEAGGYAAGITADRDEDCLSVHFLFVREDCRKRGNGSRLLAYAEERARAKGVKRVVLNTFSFQAPKFYEKLGYTQFGKVEPCFGEFGQYFYVKEL